MAVASTVLFDLPQREIASLIVDRIAKADATRIVTGFATPGGLAAIREPIRARPGSLKALVVGAATYPAFEALDDLLEAGVPSDRLRVHLGHTHPTGARRNPFARYHPMLHSKVFYMELPGSQACAFIGSHNLTSFAMTGLNGEASVMLEGDTSSPEFAKLRHHIESARSQSVIYSPDMKEAYAWWMREFIDGLRAEIKIPQDWRAGRTILLFASAARSDRPTIGDTLYFEIPAGIEQIESLKTEAHLFLFDTLPRTPMQALQSPSAASARYTCTILGAENKQGNLEVSAEWRIDGMPRPILRRVQGGVLRPQTPSGMQQVRAEVKDTDVVPAEYLFEREREAWDPRYSDGAPLLPTFDADDATVMSEAKVSAKFGAGWKQVIGLSPRQGLTREKDEAFLKLVAPDSGSFILVSLRRRRIERTRDQEERDN